MLRRQQDERQAASPTTQVAGFEEAVELIVSGSPTITIDVEEYQGIIDHLDLTEQRKRELLAAFWAMIVAFVDLGFRVKEQGTL